MSIHGHCLFFAVHAHDVCIGHAIIAADFPPLVLAVQAVHDSTASWAWTVLTESTRVATVPLRSASTLRRCLSRAVVPASERGTSTASILQEVDQVIVEDTGGLPPSGQTSDLVSSV